MKIVMTCLALSKVVNMFLIIVRALDILSMTSDGDRSFVGKESDKLVPVELVFSEINDPKGR